LQPARCESVIPGWPPRVVIRDLQSNRRMELRPRFVQVADGKGALLPDRPPTTSDFGIKAHFVGVDAPRDAIGLFGVRGRYGGVAPIEGGRWNAAFSVPASEVQRGGGDIEQAFRRTLEKNTELRRQFAMARRVGEW